MPEIDGIYVKIAGDITQLRQDMTRARAIVKESATGISNALNSALSPKQVQQGLNALIRDLGTLQRVSKLTGADFKKLGIDLQEVKHVTGLTDAQFQKLQARMLNTRAAKAQEQAFQRLTRDMNLSRLGAAKLQLQMGNVGGAAKALTTGLVSARGALIGVTTAAVSVGYLSKQLYDAAAAGQSLNVSFESIFGSSTAAAAQMDFLRDLAKRLGQNYWALADSYKGVAAASKGTNLEGEQTQKIFESVTAASTALGLSSDQTKGALNAIAQMMSKGNVQAEELRGQLGERLPGAFNLAAQAMGVTTQQLNKMLDNGEVLASDLLPKLADVLEKQYGEAAIEASKQGRSSMNRFSEAATDFATNLGTTLKPALDSILDLATKSLNAVNALMTPTGLDPKALQATLEMVRQHMADLQAQLKETPPGTDAYKSLIAALAEGGRTANQLEVKLRELQQQQEASAAAAKQLKADMQWGQSFTVSLQARIDGEKRAQAEIAALRGDSTAKELLRIEKEKQARIKAGMSAYDAEQVAAAARAKLYADEAEKKQKALDKKLKAEEKAAQAVGKIWMDIDAELYKENLQTIQKQEDDQRKHAAFLLELYQLEAINHGDTQALKLLQVQEYLEKYKELLKRGVITQEELDRLAAAKRIEINKSALQTLLEDWGNVNKNMESLTVESLKAIQTHFANTIKGVLKGEINSLEDIWQATMDAMVEIFANFIAQILAAWAAAGIANIFKDFFDFDFDFLGTKGKGGGAGGVAGGIGNMLLKKGAGMLWDKVGGDLGLPTSWKDVANLFGFGGGSLPSGAGAYLGGGESLGMFSGMDQASINAIGEEIAANLGLGTTTGTGAMGGGMGGPMGQGLADLGIGAGAGAAASLASGASAYLGGMYGGMTAAELAALGEGAAAMAGIGGGAGAAAGSSAASGAAAGAGAGASMMAALPIAAILGLAMAMGMPDPVSAIMASGGGHTKGSALNYISGDIGYLQRAEQSPGGLSLQDMVTNPSTGVVGSGSAVQMERLAERAGLSEDQIDNLILGVDDLLIKYEELNVAAEEAAAAGDQELAESLRQQAEATAQAAAETQAYAQALGFDENGLSAVGAAMYEAAQAQAVLQEQTAQIATTWQDWDGSAEQVRSQVAELVNVLDMAGINTEGMTASTSDLINQMLEGNITLGQMTDSLNNTFSAALEQAAQDGSLTAEEMEKLTGVLTGSLTAEEAFADTAYKVTDLTNQMATDLGAATDAATTFGDEIGVGLSDAMLAGQEASTVFSDQMRNNLVGTMNEAIQTGELTNEQFTDLVALFGDGEGEMGSLGEVLDAGLLTSLQDAIDDGELTADEMRKVAEAVRSIPEGYSIGVDWSWTNGPPPGYNGGGGGGGGGDKKHFGGLVLHDGGYVKMHDGGLMPGEIPTILQTGEFVFDRQDVHNFGGAGNLEAMRRSGLQQAPPQPITIQVFTNDGRLLKEQVFKAMERGEGPKPDVLKVQL